jgi:hypothetical protein
MSVARLSRPSKRQWGQFLTPPETARRIVDGLELTADDCVLEPSFGDGSFLLPLVERFMTLHAGSQSERLARVLARNVAGVEIDPALYDRCLARLTERFGPLPPHRLRRADFFRTFLTEGSRVPIESQAEFAPPITKIVGNPPFGGTIDPELQDALDAEFGMRGGLKIKKESYSFFLVKSVELLPAGGELVFLCSDSLLTIKTMRGLRRRLMELGDVDVRTLSGFSPETCQPTIELRFRRGAPAEQVVVDGRAVPRSTVELTGTLSWQVAEDDARYFAGPRLGEFVVSAGGMTVGRNEYFVRRIESGRFREPYRFEFFDDPITLEAELRRARLGRLGRRKRAQIAEQVAAGAARRNVRIVPLEEPRELPATDPDYRYYNKGIGRIVYAPPTHVIYWKDQGDAVRTFKRNGNWYLLGVGSRGHFEREGLTWQLIANRLQPRYLPPGYILDTSSPCAFLRDGVPSDELWFVLGWLLTGTCNRLLKSVLNHTKNIQGKDVEHLPYPFWVAAERKHSIVERVRNMVAEARAGRVFTRDGAEVARLEAEFAFSA